MYEKLEELKKAFDEEAESYKQGNTSDEDFFAWFCTAIEDCHGKLPMRTPDDSTPPNP